MNTLRITDVTLRDGLQSISHRFETFLMTLFREVQKRSILHSVPPSEDVKLVEGLL